MQKRSGKKKKPYAFASKVVVGNPKATLPVRPQKSSRMSMAEPNPPADLSTKGKKGGLCNMRSCLKPGAFWYNQGSHAYYCEETARELNRVNRAHWRASFPDQGPEMCFDDTDGKVTRHVSG